MFSYRIAWDYQGKNTRYADFCADRIDGITNFAVIVNVVIKRVRCTFQGKQRCNFGNSPFSTGFDSQRNSGIRIPPEQTIYLKTRLFLEERGNQRFYYFEKGRKKDGGPIEFTP